MVTRSLFATARNYRNLICVQLNTYRSLSHSDGVDSQSEAVHLLETVPLSV